MPEANWVRHSLKLGIVGARHTLIGLRRNSFRFRMLVFSAICFVIWLGGMGVLYSLYLRSLEGPFSVSSEVRLVVSALWVFAVWFLSQRALLYWRKPKAAAFVLTTVSIRTTTVGMLLTEFFTAWPFLAFPTVFLVGVVGYAFLSPVSLLAIPLSVGLFVASAIAVGYALGFASLFVTTRSRQLLTQWRLPFVQLLFLSAIVYIVGQSFGVVPAAGEVMTATWLPPSWFVDLAVLGTPVMSSGGRILACVTGSFVVIGTGTLAVERLAGAYWLTDTASSNRRSGGGNSNSRSACDERLADAIFPFFIPRIVGRSTQQVARLVLLRLRRAPRRVQFLVTVVASLCLSLGWMYVQLDTPLSIIPVASALFFPWITGAVFGLNPLGDEGPVLPVTLTSSISGREFTRGIMVPGLFYGLPVAVLCTLIGSLLSPHPAAIQLGFVCISAVLTVVAVALAPAVGIRFPRFGATTIAQSTRIVPPSMTAIVVYTFLVFALGGVSVFLLLAPSSFFPFYASGFGAAGLFRFGSIFGVLGTSLLLVWWSYRTTARRFTRYTVD